MIKLVISDNEGTTTVVPLVRDEISIGRKEGNTIRLTERNISRQHCRIQRSNGSYVIHDLGSYNGVVINGQRIAGESQVKPGDEIRIGDYTLLLQTEAAEKPTAEIAVDPAQPVAAPAPRSPARLFVLTPPVAGAEFPLPERGELRIGRAPELDVTLDHRSVSREHAKLVCDGGEVRVLDRGSVNGVVVNGEKVTDARLAPGDLVELGDVLLRFVGTGEHYVFDPEEARSLAGHKRARSRKSWPAAAAIGVGSLLIAILIVRSSPKSDPEPVAAAPTSRTTAVAAVPDEVTTPAAAAAPAEAERFAELLRSCLDANGGGRFAEAVAHANAALKVRADAPEALACQEQARVNHEQEQIFVRGKAALEARDLDGALKELSSLSADSAVRQRPEVSQAIDSLAQQRLAQGQQLLRRQPEQAGNRAREVLALSPLSDDVRAQADALLARAEEGRPAARTARNEPTTATNSGAAPALRGGAAIARRPSEPRTKPAAGDGKSAMDTASACLARGDNPCVIRALNGRAQTAQELGLLIETYRAMGETPQAYRNMTIYVQRFPTARRAEAYRQMLARRTE
jgi:pSer/pThr/pTyr-binding forkhead associated (FHA) protein